MSYFIAKSLLIILVQQRFFAIRRLHVRTISIIKLISVQLHLNANLKVISRQMACCLIVNLVETL